MQLSDTFWEVFGWIGILTAAGFVALMAYSAFDALRGVVYDWRWNYKYKHRFDKPPTAKCYCKDCIYHGTTYKDGGNNKCDVSKADIWTPDEGFCFKAEPKKRDVGND